MKFLFFLALPLSAQITHVTSYTTLPIRCSVTTGDIAFKRTAPNPGLYECVGGVFQQIGGGAVSSVFGRTGAITSQSGDYVTSQITESGNLYLTTQRVRDAMAGLYESPLTFNSTYFDRTGNTVTIKSQTDPGWLTLTVGGGRITGLGGAASLGVGTTAGTVAAGDHNHNGVYENPLTFNSNHFTRATNTVSFKNCVNDGDIWKYRTSGGWGCEADQTTPGGSGITTLNTLTAASQSFAKVDDDNMTLTIASSSSTHTFTLAWAGTLAKGRQNSHTLYDDGSYTDPTWITLTAAGGRITGFALTGHNHSGVYEPVLGNPASDGYLLSSTAAGTRSWIAPPSSMIWPSGAGGLAIYSGSNSWSASLAPGASAGYVPRSTGAAWAVAQLQYTDLGALPTLPSNTTATTNNFFTAYNSTTGAFTKARPTCSDLSDAGTGCTGSSLPNVTNDVQTKNSIVPNTFTGIRKGNSGTADTNPTYSDIIALWTTCTGYLKSTGLCDAGPVVPANTTGTSHQFFSAYNSSTGAFTKTQPVCADLSDAGTGCALTAVTNDAQTKAAIVPNTIPSAAQILVGNAGGTAYAPVTMSGGASMIYDGTVTLGNPGPSTKGGVKSLDCTGSGHIVKIDTAGTPTCAADTGGTLVNVLGSNVSNPDFNNTTPAASSGYSNVQFQVSSSSVSAQIPFSWSKVSIGYASVQTAALTNAVSAFSIPASATILAVRIKEATAFSGNAGTLTVSLGDATPYTQYAPAWSLKQTVAATNMYNDGGSYATTTNSHTIYANFTSSSGNLSTLSAGSVDIWVLVSVLP